MIPARSKLMAPVASGVLHAGLLGLIVGFGMGAVPPAATPLMVELVQPDILPAPSAAGGKPDLPHAPEGASAAQVAQDPLKTLDHGMPRPAAQVRPARPRPATRALAQPDSAPPHPAVAERRLALPEVAPQAAAPAAPLAVAVSPGLGEAAMVAAGISEAVALAGNPRPTYPWLARQRHIEGRVLLRVRVDAEGRPSGVDVARSSGFALLDESAREAVAQWTFRPAHTSGIAVPAEVEVPVAFRLADAETP